MYNDFLADPESDAEYTQSGRLRVAVDDANAARLERLDARTEADQPGTPEGDEAWRGVDARKFAYDLTTYVPGDELRETLVVPPLNTDAVAGALYRPMYGHIRSDE